MKRLGLLLLLFVPLVMVSCGQKSGKKVVVATDASWSPMEFMSSNKQIVGFDIDLMKEVAKKGGFDIEFKNASWKSLFSGLNSGKYDAVISSVMILGDQKKTVDFSRPYINAGQVLIVRSDVNGVSTLKDLSGKTLGAESGKTGSFQIDKYAEELKLKKKTYDKISAAMDDLVSGGIDAVVVELPLAARFVLQTPKYKGKLKIVGSPLTQEYYGIAVKKGNTKLLDKINKGLTEVLKKDINKDLEDKWLR